VQQVSATGALQLAMQLSSYVGRPPTCCSLARAVPPPAASSWVCARCLGLLTLLLSLLSSPCHTLLLLQPRLGLSLPAMRVLMRCPTTWASSCRRQTSSATTWCVHSVRHNNREREDNNSNVSWSCSMCQLCTGCTAFGVTHAWACMMHAGMSAVCLLGGVHLGCIVSNRLLAVQRSLLVRRAVMTCAQR
jgi:hypothetical protein